MNAYLGIVACTLIALSASAEPARPAGKAFENFKLITGFHSHLDKATGFEFRILEVDRSATVAMDPIELFFVATNNSSADELQSTIVILPKVSAIKQVQFLTQPHTIEIEALFDRANKDGSKHWTVPATIEISVPIKDGKLPTVIEASVTTKRKAEQGGSSNGG